MVLENLNMQNLIGFCNDKVIINTSIFKDIDLISNLASEFGRQCIVGSLDIKKEKDGYHFYISNGESC